MRSNKIHNADLFTQAANERFQKHVKTQSKQALEIIDRAIDWTKLLEPLERKLRRVNVHQSSVGRKPHALVVIVKCMLLQYLHSLSDPRLEEEIADRRSFQIFLGLTSADAIPDETTVCRYRELFARHELDRLLFDSFTRQLAAQRLIVGKGTIVDASLKQAQATSSSGRDTDARFTKRGHRTFYGYKGHIGVDAETTVIHSLKFTPAHLHDTKQFEALLQGSERIVYADKGYANQERKRQLRAQGIRDGILDKGNRNTPLTIAQRQRNKKRSAVRNRVEQAFAFMKRILLYDRCRYYDLARNRLQFVFCALLYNIRGTLTLTAGVPA
jgi:IS5 family transposase